MFEPLAPGYWEWLVSPDSRLFIMFVGFVPSASVMLLSGSCSHLHFTTGVSPPPPIVTEVPIPGRRPLAMTGPVITSSIRIVRDRLRNIFFIYYNTFLELSFLLFLQTMTIPVNIPINTTPPTMG